MKSKGSYGLILLLSSVSTMVFILIVDHTISALGLGLFMFTFLLYVKRLGETIPVLEFMMLMATAQWVFGAYNAYMLDMNHFRYYMYVDEVRYMNIVVPGTATFIAGILIVYPKLEIVKISDSIKKLANEQPKIAYYLMGVGFVLPILNSFIPVALGFVVFLMSNFKYVGMALLLFRENSKQKWQILIGVMTFSLIVSLSKGMFHDLLLWGALMFSFVALELNLKFIPKMLIISGGLLFVIILQSIKSQYREMIIIGNYTSETKLELFYGLMSSQMNNLDNLFSDETLGMLNVRLNQGWIISAIIDNIPTVEPYANGETINEAIIASIVPRFLSPNKKEAGGQENFERFTGLAINAQSTSMGTSIIGEAYGNYGKQGSWVFMFIWGVFISMCFRKLVKFAETHPIMYFILPIIFLQVIKAETEFYVVLNHFIKSSILIFILYWVSKKFLHWQI